MTPQEIRRAYRAKSLKLHPDKNPGGEVEAAADFSEVANAYEVLSDAATRRDYDYVLAHPEEFFSNHYKYYRYKYRRMDGRAVCLVLVLLLSALQYANMWLTHRRFKRCAANLPTFKLREAQLKRQRLSEIEAEVRSQGGGKRAKRKAKILLQSELQAGEGPSLEVELEGREARARCPGSQISSSGNCSSSPASSCGGCMISAAGPFSTGFSSASILSRMPAAEPCGPCASRRNAGIKLPSLGEAWGEAVTIKKSW